MGDDDDVSDFQPCGICRQACFRASRDMLYRRGKRYWVHKVCYLQEYGLEGLSKNQLEDLPVLKVRELGLLDEVERRLGYTQEKTKMATRYRMRVYKRSSPEPVLWRTHNVFAQSD